MIKVVIPQKPKSMNVFPEVFIREDDSNVTGDSDNDLFGT